MIYIHIPFCKSRCLYCDFFSSTESTLKDNYVDALINEIHGRADEIRSAGANTIYIGGGTPSQLDLSDIIRIFEHLQKVVSLEQDAEVTIECNPDDVTDCFAAGLKSTPVNRISMGVQTFNDDLLKLLRRRHTSAQAHKAVRLLRSEGFENISLDLIFGLPGQSLEMWKYDVDTLLSLKTPHISAYSLQWEDGTELYKMLERGEVMEAPDELSLEMYQYLLGATRQAGMEHYEISNFALPGLRAKHNSGYWRNDAYVGLGPGAHSFDGRNMRSSNPANLQAYIVSAGMPQRDVEMLSDDEIYEECVLKGLRTMDGLNLDSLKPFYREYALKMVKHHIEAGRVERNGNILRLTEKGVFVSNDIMSDMML